MIFVNYLAIHCLRSNPGPRLGFTPFKGTPDSDSRPVHVRDNSARRRPAKISLLFLGLKAIEANTVARNSSDTRCHRRPASRERPMPPTEPQKYSASCWESIAIAVIRPLMFVGPAEYHAQPLLSNWPGACGAFANLGV
jgi:hypothetical protein